MIESSTGSCPCPQVVLLAPSGATIPGEFRSVQFSSATHESLIADMQKMRGKVYLDDGAIKPSDLDSFRRHRMAGDEQSWHILRVGPAGGLVGCARILVHKPSVGFPMLRLASSTPAKREDLSDLLQIAVERELANARSASQMVVELGGWAIVPEMRGTLEALTMAVSAFAWSQFAGGCVGFLTATVRHGSSSILRRLGGKPLHHGRRFIPPYYDPAYGCDMEILRFDSGCLNPRFEPALDRARKAVGSAPVICGEDISYQLSQSAA